jgi:hypothetical protein
MFDFASFPVVTSSDSLVQVPLQAAALEGLASPSFAPSLSSSSREEETFENIPGQLSSSG